MRKRAEFSLPVTLLAGLVFVLMSSAAFAGLPGGGLVTPCDFFDQAVIGTAGVNLGAEAVIPVRVTSDGSVTGFRFEIQMPSGVTADKILVENVDWPLPLLQGQEWWFYAGSPSYVVITDAGATLEQPNDVVLLNIRINTHCWTTNVRTNNLVWVPGANPPGTPKSYLRHPGCTDQVLSVRTNGSFTFNSIRVAFDIPDVGANMWEQVEIPVTCDNDYLFSSFSHRVYYNKNVVHYLDNTTTDRTVGSVTFTNHEPEGYVEVSGSNPGGFGTWMDGLEFYGLIFEVITALDDSTTATFWFSSWQVRAIDCEQVLGSLSAFAYTPHTWGVLGIHPLRVTFDFGDIFSNPTNPCELKMPVYLKNNCVVGPFRTVVGYDVGISGLDFVRFEPSGGFPVGFSQEITCGPEETYFTLFTTNPSVRIPASAASVRLGTLVFQDGTGTDGHTLGIVASDCMFNTTFVQAYNLAGVFFKSYDEDDPQTVFTPGSISNIDPLAVKIYMPPASSQWYPPKHVHTWWATTTFWVKNTMDLSSMTFKITWNPNTTCVTQQGVGTYFPNAAITVNAELGEATVTITDLPATPDSVRWGWIGFTNGRRVDNVFTPGVPDASIQFSAVCPGQQLPASVEKTIGVINLKFVPSNAASCTGDDPYDEDEHSDVNKPSAVPYAFDLLQNRPNPFNASTIIDFTLAEGAQTTLEVYNVRGQRVRVVLDAFTEAGMHTATWDGRDADGNPVASGIYLYRLTSGRHTESKKMVLMK